LISSRQQVGWIVQSAGKYSIAQVPTGFLLDICSLGGDDTGLPFPRVSYPIEWAIVYRQVRFIPLLNVLLLVSIGLQVLNVPKTT
jgi:hypothetical protein